MFLCLSVFYLLKPLLQFFKLQNLYLDNLDKINLSIYRAEIMSQTATFHLAIPIHSIAEAKKFYADGLGCEVGRENKAAVIFNFYGTQLVGHITKEALSRQPGIYPRHLGLILPTKADWQQICDRAQKQNLTFYHQPKLRFPQQALEHYAFFLEDPFHNLLEFKYYSEPEVIFGGRQSNLIGETATAEFNT